MKISKTKRSLKTTKPLPDKSKPYERFRASFSELRKPSKTPKMPKKISDQTSAEVSDLMLLISAWRDFTDDLIYEATRDVIITREKYQQKWDITFMSTSGSSVKEREARTRTDQVIRKLRIKLDNVEMYLEMLERKYENYTNNIQLISREITRRANNV